MLLRTEAVRVLAIAQQSHAWISGQLARAWGNDLFHSPQPWEEVCLATEQHDIGMAAWDLEPTLNPETGLPHSFLEMPLEVHLGLWSTAPDRLLGQSRYAALLVSMHGARLYRRRDLDELPAEQAEAVRSYLAAQTRFQRRIIESLERDPITEPWVKAPLLERNSQLVWTWDFLSLVICLDWAPRAARAAPGVDGPRDIEIVPGPRPRTAVLDPWPFSVSALAVRCDARMLNRHFVSEHELRAELARAPWIRVEFEFLPT